MSDFVLLPDEQDELERLAYEIEHSKLPARRHAAQLLLLRKLHSACRSLPLGRRPLAIQRVLERIPLNSDKEAWDRLAAERRAELELTPPH
jgi:hypothetical protein